jgi:Ribbon-helix-helix protein, copG family
MNNREAWARRGVSNMSETSAMSEKVQDSDCPHGIRLSVRLPPELAERLTEYLKQTAMSQSDLVREALYEFISNAQCPAIAPSMPETAPPASAETNAKPIADPEPYQMPGQLKALQPSLRAFGAAMWSERRCRFGLLLALSDLALQSSGSPRDLDICAALLRLGKQFDLL